LLVAGLTGGRVRGWGCLASFPTICNGNRAKDVCAMRLVATKPYPLPICLMAFNISTWAVLLSGMFFDIAEVTLFIQT